MLCLAPQLVECYVSVHSVVMVNVSGLEDVKPGDNDTGQLTSRTEADVMTGGHWLTASSPASVSVSRFSALCLSFLSCRLLIRPEILLLVLKRPVSVMFRFPGYPQFQWATELTKGRKRPKVHL